MAIFRGTGGSGSSSDSTIVDAVTAQATIATTKRNEAEGFRDEAEGFKNTASTAATTATTKATEANASATTAEGNKDLCVDLRGETFNLAQDALASADAAEASATTANSSAVQTVAGSNTQVVGVYNNIANVNTVAGVNTDVTTVAGISSDVTTVAADASDIGTVSTNIANVNNVGNNIANVNAVHSNASNINTVAADGTDIGTVATNIANVNTVAGISSTVTTVAGLESKMDTVIADASDIGAVAGNIGDVTTVAGINSDVDTVAGIAAKVTTVADNISDVQNADTNATNAASSASNASASATSASNSATTATTKATEASNSATAASNSATTATTKASQAAGSATTAGTSASTATTKASEASASATTATTKAGEAASSASAASGSATTAVTKASEASVSAASAATSATNSSNAASTWNNFYNSYLGVADAPPSVDVLGNAIVAGALYYDTGAGSNTVGLYVYNGSSWVYSTNYNNVTAPYSLSQDLATNGNDISFGDNAKAQFGASNDLQIYHDGVSRIKEVGANGLYVDVTNDMYIRRGDTSAVMAEFNAGVAKLMFDGSQKLATTATGIDVTGTATMDGLTVDGAGYAYLGNTAAYRGELNYDDSGNTALTIANSWNNDNSEINFKVKTAGTGKQALQIKGSGDISFYEDTGTTPSLLWDSSATALTITGRESSRSSNTYAFEVDNSAQTSNLSASGSFRVKGNTGDSLVVTGQGNVGIGTSSPDAKFHVSSSGDTIARITSADGNSAFLDLGDASDPDGGRIVYSGSNLALYTASTERMRIDSSGNVGIGTASPASEVDISKASGGDSALSLTSTGVQRHQIIQKGTGDGSLVFYNQTANAERMRIDSSGNVLVGTTDTFVADNTSGNGLSYRASAGDLGVAASNTPALYANRMGSHGAIADFRKNGTTVGSIGSSNSDLTIGNSDVGLKFHDVNNIIYPWNVSTDTASDGLLGLGSSSIRFKDLYLSGTANAGIVSLKDGNNNGQINATTSGAKLYYNVHDSHIWQRQGSEKARIDSSGNLLVGTTDNTLYNNTTGGGANILADGLTTIARQTATTSDTVFVLNDTGAGGSMQEFRKDGTTVGSIGTYSTDLTIGTTVVGVRFDDNASSYIPWNVSTNAATDATINLGHSSVRYKDLYLSKRVYSGNPTNTAGNLFLHIDGDADGVSTGYKIRSGVGVSTGSSHIAFVNPNGIVGQIRTDGSVTSYNTSSDERLKENIQDAEDAGSKIDAIQIRQFDWKSDGSHQDYGVIAQELLEVAPEAVSEGGTEDDMMSVDYSKLVPTLIKEIQTLRNRVAQLENN